MFLRKLMVMVVPLALLAAVCVLLPVVNGLGFWSHVLKGLMLGAALALLLPLSGAGRKKEPFAGLLWVPTILTAAIAAYQYLAAERGLVAPVLTMLATTNGQVVLAECAFVGFMLVTCVRTRK